jgi:chemotaxis protein methyltransferase CheR
MKNTELSDSEFMLFRNMIYEIAGINLTIVKKPLVSGRLSKRLKHYGVGSYHEYFKLIKSNVNGELQTAIDLLTTNETFFFREPKHFDFLRDTVLPKQTGPLRVWSAASSSGEEAYTLAMMLAEYARAPNWEITGTDISTRVLERARSGHYPLDRTDGIPQQLLHKYCLKGVGSQDGTFLICRELLDRVSFIHANLKSDLSRLGSFDVIFLRNVMIYFDLETKRQVASRIIRQLKPGGYLFVSHSESLNGVTDEVTVVKPSIYRKP